MSHGLLLLLLCCCCCYVCRERSIKHIHSDCLCVCQFSAGIAKVSAHNCSIPQIDCLPPCSSCDAFSNASIQIELVRRIEIIGFCIKGQWRCNGWMCDSSLSKYVIYLVRSTKQYQAHIQCYEKKDALELNVCLRKHSTNYVQSVCCTSRI